jgi:hypothetical protein
MSEAVYEVYHAVNVVPLPEKEIVVYSLFYIFINWHGYILRLVLSRKMAFSFKKWKIVDLVTRTEHTRVPIKKIFVSM